MTTLSVRYSDIKNCETCQEGFFNELATPQNCSHIFCTTCINMIANHTQAQRSCSLCRVEILNSSDTTRLEIDFHKFSYYFFKNNFNGNEQAQKKPVEEMNHDCPICQDKESSFQPIYFHSGKFWHAGCLPADRISTATTWYPSQIVAVGRDPELPPLIAKPCQKSFFEKRPYLKSVFKLFAGNDFFS